jgi:hypothetical protein
MMGAMDIKRCPHCVGRLSALPLDELDGFDAPGPAVYCDRCDSIPNEEEPLFVPHGWDS